MIAGPTGSGKSHLALSLAEDFVGEIVNCDSVQVYRHLDIGTAKLPTAARRGIPHHLMDIIDPDAIFTAGDYARAARNTLREISGRGRLPIVVGGTGFYLRALLHGLFEGPIRDNALRAKLADRKTPLHRILKRLDPAAAARIHANDTQKLIRAIEVCLVTRRPMTSLHREGSTPLSGYSAVLIGLDPPRDLLYRRLNERCAEMFAGGLVNEVEAILAMPFSQDAKALESIGYRQAVGVLAGQMSVEEAIENTQQSTRQYAKRQLTWFRREAGVHWIPGFGDAAETYHAAKELVQSAFSRAR